MDKIFSTLKIERVNRTRYRTRDEARARIEAWRQDYNQHRPRGSLGNLTPREYAKRGQENAGEATIL